MVATRSRAQSVIGESSSSFSCILLMCVFSPVTGCLGWTVYPLPDYRGRGLCLLPSDEVRCNPGFYVSALRRGEINAKIILIIWLMCSLHGDFQTSSAVWGGAVTQTTFCIQTTDSQYRRIESFQARIYFQIIPLSAQPLDLFTEFHTYMQQCTRAPLRPACCEVYFITRVKEKKTSSPILPSIYSSHIIHLQMATTVPWLIFRFLNKWVFGHNFIVKN